MGYIRRVELVKTVYDPDDSFPEPKRGDVAFVGRSNVGKSTLLNVLFGRKMAHVSKNPGKTRSINFYLVNSSFYMVDLPGYGYARVSREERLRWTKLVERYFSKRWSLKLVFVLVDARHGLTSRDENLIEWIRDFDLPFAIILTKMDKIKRSDRKNSIEGFKRNLSRYGDYTVIPYSALTGEGVDRILKMAFMAVGLLSGGIDREETDDSGG